MIDKLFPSKIDAKWSNMKTKLKENFKVVSELECGAHAALAIGDTDFWSYNENTQFCFLGELTNTKEAGTTNALRNVRVLRSKLSNVYMYHLLKKHASYIFFQQILGMT